MYAYNNQINRTGLYYNFFTSLILFQYNKPFDKDYRNFMEPGR